jgi:hypothetical protein
MARRIKGTEARIDIVPDDQGLLRLAEECTAELKRATKGIDSIAKGWKLTATGLDSALNLANGFVSAIGFARDVLKDAAAQQVVDKAFTKQFDNADAALKTLRASIQGALSDSEIKRISSQFERAGLSIEQIGGVFDTAARISATTGQAVAEVTEELQDAIIGASDSNLEKFGIIADLPELAKKYAKQQGIATDEIDKSVESAAILNEVLTNVSDRFADADVNNMHMQLGRLEARMANLNDQAAQFAMAVATGIAQDVGILDPAAVEDAQSKVAAYFKEFEGAGALFQQVAAEAVKFEGAQKRFIDLAKQSENQATRLAAGLAEVRAEASRDDLAFRQLEEQLKAIALRSMPAFTSETLTAAEKQSILTADVLELADSMGMGARVLELYTQRTRRMGEAAEAAALSAAKLADEQARSEGIEAMKARAQAEEAAFKRRMEREEALYNARQRRGGARAAKREDPADGLGVLRDFQASGLFKRIAGPDELSEFGTLKEELFSINELIDRNAEAFQRQQAAIDAASNSYERMSANILGMSDSFNGSIGDIGVLIDQGYQMAQAWEQAEKAGKNTAQVGGMMAAAAIKSGAGVAKAWGASLAFTETLFGMADAAMMATMIAKAVKGDPIAAAQAALYGVSSAQHFAAAAMAGSKGGGGGGGRRAAAAPPRAPSAIFGGQDVTGEREARKDTIVFSGSVIVGPGGVAEAERAIGSMMDRRGETGEGRNFTPAG